MLTIYFKTFIGIELIRVLLNSNVGPILLIAFTNHALDHMLTSIVNAKITDASNVVRLGGRPSDPAVIPYSMEELERTIGRTQLGRSLGSDYAEMKMTEDAVARLLGSLIGSSIPSHLLMSHLCLSSPDHYESFYRPPQWVRDLHRFYEVKERTGSSEGRWRKVGRGGKEDKGNDVSTYGLWRSSVEYEFLGAMMNSSREELGDSELSSIALQAELSLAREPLTDRSVEELTNIEESDVWTYSINERKRMHNYWADEYRNSIYDSNTEELKRLLEKHETLRKKHQSNEEAVRTRILSFYIL